MARATWASGAQVQTLDARAGWEPGHRSLGFRVKASGS